MAADFMKHERWNKTFLRKSSKGGEPAEPAGTSIPTVCGTGATAAAGRESSRGPVLQTRLGTEIPRHSTGLLKVFLRRPHSVSLLHWVGAGRSHGLCLGCECTRRPALLPHQSTPSSREVTDVMTQAGNHRRSSRLSDPPRAPLTVIHAAAEAALVPPPAFDELHERTHVGFAPVASDWSSLPVVYQVEGRLQEASRSERHVGTGLPGFFRSPTIVVTEM